MASKNQMTGMLGVYLTAAELTARGFIVSPTSRSAAGADLLVTDQECKRAWSVQVKTNRTPAKFWLLNQHAGSLKSDSHVYVFVNLKGSGWPEYLVVPSAIVAAKVCQETAKTGSVWYSFYKDADGSATEGWEVFGDPGSSADMTPEVTAASGEPAGAELDFKPVEISGEPLSETILRERR